MSLLKLPKLKDDNSVTNKPIMNQTTITNISRNGII